MYLKVHLVESWGIYSNNSNGIYISVYINLCNSWTYFHYCSSNQGHPVCAHFCSLKDKRAHELNGDHQFQMFCNAGEHHHMKNILISI